MTNNSQIVAGQQGRLFGVPFGDLGWFASLLMTLASGFLVFFLTTFFGIMGLLIYGASSHKPVNYADSYLHIGLPCGIVALVIVGGFLGTLWLKRIARKA